MSKENKVGYGVLNHDGKVLTIQNEHIDRLTIGDYNCEGIDNIYIIDSKIDELIIHPQYSKIRLERTVVNRMEVECDAAYPEVYTSTIKESDTFY